MNLHLKLSNNYLKKKKIKLNMRSYAPILYKDETIRICLRNLRKQRKSVT